jgi:hypothetical protein
MFATLDTGALLQIGFFVLAGMSIAILILSRKNAPKVPTDKGSQRAILRERAAAEEPLAKEAKMALPVPPFPDAPMRNSRSTIFELDSLQPQKVEQHASFQWNNFVGATYREATPLKVAQIYSKLGYKTSFIKPTDQGVDVIAEISGQRIAINCKHGAVGNAAVHAVYAGARRYKCNRTMVVTTSRFTREAKKLAEITGTELVDGAMYQKLVYQTMAGG